MQAIPESRPVILLAGAAHGIGRAIAQLATERGFALAACDIDEAGLEALREREGGERLPRLRGRAPQGCCMPG